MAAIQTIDVIATKWMSVARARTPDYEAGIKAPRRDWATAAAAAENSWSDGVTSAITRKAFSKGVASAGSAKWSARALNPGVSRWAPGIAVSQAAYASGFGPYRNAIEACTLPPRYARRDIRNLDRVSAIVACLVAEKAKH
jgi:hypothetical protein